VKTAFWRDFGAGSADNIETFPAFTALPALTALQW
jgi:hypothetical protein